MKFPLKDILALRFILRQPSPLWKEFYITDIEIIRNNKHNSKVIL